MPKSSQDRAIRRIRIRNVRSGGLDIDDLCAASPTPAWVLFAKGTTLIRTHRRQDSMLGGTVALDGRWWPVEMCCRSVVMARLACTCALLVSRRTLSGSRPQTESRISSTVAWCNSSWRSVVSRSWRANASVIHARSLDRFTSPVCLGGPAAVERAGPCSARQEVAARLLGRRPRRLRVVQKTLVPSTAVEDEIYGRTGRSGRSSTGLVELVTAPGRTACGRACCGRACRGSGFRSGPIS